MARVTVEDCLKHVENRFALVHLTAHRVRQVIDGSKLKVECDNKEIVTVLREIGRGLVLPKKVSAIDEDEANLKIDIPDIK
jgi:DNA-directed RNA polymerase subunit omega